MNAVFKALSDPTWEIEPVGDSCHLTVTHSARRTQGAAPPS
ncbi:hypothetical protein [Pseudarthrobacter albicanus]|nr:hypothetical protein [Pseudarthrobacter albicanus]